MENVVVLHKRIGLIRLACLNVWQVNLVTIVQNVEMIYILYVLETIKPVHVRMTSRQNFQTIISSILDLAPQYIQVLNASTPAVLNVTAMVFNWTGNEWYRAFNNKTNDYWNGNTFPGANYAYLTFNDYYLLTSFQVTARGDYYHDIKTLEFYRSANGTCLLESFDFAAPPSTYYTYSATSFNYQTVPITGSGVLANFWRWSTYQLWLSELTFYGIPY